MNEVIIETIVQIATTLLLTLIGVLGTWLTAKIGKKKELEAISAATWEATEAAQRTVLELQQTVVEGMKAASEDGKLSDAEIKELGALLLEKAMAQMSQPAIDLLTSAGKDISTIIQSAGEGMILSLKQHKM